MATFCNQPAGAGWLVRQIQYLDGPTRTRGRDGSRLEEERRHGERSGLMGGGVILRGLGDVGLAGGVEAHARVDLVGSVYETPGTRRIGGNRRHEGQRGAEDVAEALDDVAGGVHVDPQALA